jgi:hypothetical protein
MDDCLVCLPCIPDSHLYKMTSTKCRINTVVSPDDGHIVVRNMYKKNKHTKKNCAPSWLYLEDYFVLSVCPSVRMEQLGSYWTDFDEILCNLNVLRKSVEKILVLLISDNNNGYFTWSAEYICGNICFSPSSNEKCFGQRREDQNTHFMFSNVFFPKALPFMS